ncbi:MAG: sigma-70 family RNA polymerase sigma factor [Prevotella sp.]|nr:sigma-70 family RNA polymerase sigma factor [Prevotella sp.]
MKNVSFRNDVLPLKDVLYRLALRITLQHEDAEDIVQDTLIKVWNKRDEWQDIDSIEAYSLTICRNLALDRLKRKDCHSESIDTIHLALHDATASPYEQIDQKDRLQIVKNIVNALPEKQRSCMQLRDFEGKTYKEIASIMNISEDQVKINLFRARQTVKQRYQDLASLD